MNERMTVKEVAYLLGVKSKTVLKWIREGRLNCKRELRHKSNGQIGYLITVSKTDLEDFEVDNYQQLGYLNKLSRKAERKMYLTMLDELEEELYDNACLICEMREKLEKMEL